MKIHKVDAHRIDMLSGPLFKKLLIFALPIALSSILQQLFNSADVAVVGNFATSQALAAVGSNAPVISLIITLFTGISVGANVVIAKYIGKHDREKISDVIHTVLILAALCGVVLAVAGQFFAEPLLTLMDTPHDVMDLAVMYLRIYFVGMPFIMIYNFGSAILRSKGDTKRPLYCLIVSGGINVALNLLFVIQFNMSVSGVAVATVIANVVSSGFIIRFLMTEEEDFRLHLKKLKVNKHQLIKVLKIGLPAGLQGMVFSLSNIVIQSAINGFGSDASAGSAAAVNFEYFSYYMVNAFAQAAVTFTSQNYGAGQFERCKKIFVRSMILSMVLSEAMSIIFVVFGGFFCGNIHSGRSGTGLCAAPNVMRCAV